MRTVATTVTNEKVNVAICQCDEDDLQKAAVAVLVAAVTDLSEQYGTGEARLAAAEEIGARIARIAAENLERMLSK